MAVERAVREVFRSRPVIEGAGVHLKRAFGFGETSLFDPFLLLDDFRSSEPEHYRKGFPWHPHRGIETITYVLRGDVEHGDSLGNRGDITAGDVQWMTAGSGIIHQEMPRGDGEGRLEGFQLWANLPAAQKMMPPRYRDVKARQIPAARLDDGATIRVICGRAAEVAGPVHDIVTDPHYLDIQLPSGVTFTRDTVPGHTVLAYVIDGGGRAGGGGEVANEDLLLFGDGEVARFEAGPGGMRFLFFSGRPIGEPVAWQGPIVMNTQEELETAFAELRNDTFIKHGKPEG